MKSVMPGLGDTFRPAADSFARARLSSFQTRRRPQAGSRSRLCFDKSLPTLSPLHSTAQRFPGREAPASSPGFSQARPGGPTSLTTTNPSPGQSFSRRKRDETKLVAASSHPGALFPMGRRPGCPPGPGLRRPSAGHMTLCAFWRKERSRPAWRSEVSR
jgi:hypothetical protein